jgi:hypothetical protein
LSKTLAEKVTDFFKPQAPLWACELTHRHVIVAGAASNRKSIANRRVESMLPEGGLGGARPVIRELLSQCGFKGSEIAVVIPDETARIAFVTAENPTSNPEEQQTFIRWKLKKSVPFDVDEAQVAYRVLGPNRTGAGVDILVALSPRSVVHEYEQIFESLDIHAGTVLPSTLAALNLMVPPPGDALFVKVAPDGITTTVFQRQRIQFYRRVTDASLYDAIYPTVLYHQDKLGGTRFERLYVCGYDEDLRYSFEEIQDRLALLPQRIEPQSVDDIYKPALGAVHLRPEGSW